MAIMKKYRNITIEIYETETGFSWKCKKENEIIIAEPDGEWDFEGEDESVALENARQAIDNYYCSLD